MSGNPFRRSVALNTATSGLSGTAFSAGNNGPLSTVSKAKKHVRVASPPPSPPETSSPEPEPDPRPDPVFVRRLSTSRHAGSPPPAAFLAEDSYSDGTANEPSDDSPAARDDDPDDAPLKTNAADIRTSMDSAPTSPGVPNPFARTLETIEQGSRKLPAHNDAQGQSGKVAAAATRASMDVDSFKRLLLTGRADAESYTVSTSAGATIQKTVASAGDDARGSAELSPISRHALFGALHAGLDDSPRSSYERSASDGVDDDDHATLIGGGKKPDKKKPPPPRHKHGKSITLTKRGPQVVSFADFSPSFVSREAKDTPGRPRSQSDVNKPLPPRPRAASGNVEKDLPVVPQAEALSIETATADAPSSSSSPSQQQRRKPPTPPLSRRHSQLRSVASEPRSRSNSTTASASASASSAPDEPFSDTNASSSSPSSATYQPFAQNSGGGGVGSAGNKPPPPPPARRSAATSVSSSSDLSNTIIATPSRSSSRRSTASSIHQPNPSAFAGKSGSAKGSSGPSSPMLVQQQSSSRSRTASAGSERLWEVRAEEEEEEGIGGGGGGRVGASGVTGLGLGAGVDNETDKDKGMRKSVDMLSELDKLQREVEALRERSAGAGASAGAGRRIS
ncbi:hypothetical protein IWX49DRAFT_421846 [Phyllosticta citricarpa]